MSKPMWGLGVLTGALLSACSMANGGLSAPASGGDKPIPTDASASVDAPLSPLVTDAQAREVLVSSGPFEIAGEPRVIGCADGTREAFLDLSPLGWPQIAGCAGGWSVPGLMLYSIRTPVCRRVSGNSSVNPAGVGCAAADLCAAGWHICAGPHEVQMLSRSHCESALPRGVIAFFAVAGGATETGDCVVGGILKNDIRGCGSLGQPEGDGCYPLDRRLEFDDCLKTEGVWQCASAAEHLLEAEKVFKTSPLLGGVLCCRDDV